MAFIKIHLFNFFFWGYFFLSLISGIMAAYFFKSKKGYALFPALSLILFMISWYFRRIRPVIFHSKQLQELAVFFSYSWLGSILIMSVIFICFAAFFFILDKNGFKIKDSIMKWLPVSAAAISIMSALYFGMRQPPVKRIDIYSSQVSASLDGYKIVQLSDIHLDSGMKMRHFKKTMARINALDADLILITGDVIDPGLDLSRSPDFFKPLKAKDGVFASIGNHDVYYSRSDRSIPLLRRMGLKVLHNESINLERLRITGIGDIGSEYIKASKAVSLVGKTDKKSLPEIVMSHQPLYYPKIAEKNPMLVLSGHTHRGQIFPFSLYVRHVFRYFYGHYSIGETHFYVTSGTDGWGPRMRFLTSSEIPVITLKQKK